MVYYSIPGFLNQAAAPAPSPGSRLRCIGARIGALRLVQRGREAHFGRAAGVEDRVVPLWWWLPSG